MLEAHETACAFSVATGNAPPKRKRKPNWRGKQQQQQTSWLARWLPLCWLIDHHGCFLLTYCLCLLSHKSVHIDFTTKIGLLDEPTTSHCLCVRNASVCKRESEREREIKKDKSEWADKGKLITICAGQIERKRNHWWSNWKRLLSGFSII